MESPQKRPKGSVPAKFVLKKEAQPEAPKHKRYEDGIALLVKKQNEIIKEKKDRKAIAAEALAKDPKNKLLQNKLAEAIKATHITTGQFIEKLGNTFQIRDKVIHYQNVPIAKLLDTDNKEAYSEIQPAQGPGYSPVYKRVTLDGHGDKEYVSINGAMLRRTAYRGITPHEHDLISDKKELTPFYANELFRETPGRHFNDNGSSFERPSTTTSDVEFLQSLGSIKKDAFPADEKGLLTFTQIRQGASKLLSATSTNHEIKSNHGEGFNKFGLVTIDLAKVPTGNVLHHYNVEAFDSGKVRGMIAKINEQSIRSTHNSKNPAPAAEVIRQQAVGTINDEAIDYHVERGNLSFIRNREILFTSIPYGAITGKKMSSSRVDYIDEFVKAFTNRVNELLKDFKFQVVKENMVGDTDAIAKVEANKYTQSFTKNQGGIDGRSDAWDYMNSLRTKENEKIRLAKQNQKKQYPAQHGNTSRRGNRNY